MRRVVRVLLAVLLLVALTVRPAGAGLMLIATAATDGFLDSFCLHDNGKFVSGISRGQIALRSPNPRAILFVAEDRRPGQTDAGVLYVAEPDRVEAIRFGPDGNVARHCGDSGTEACRGQTEVHSGMDARAMVVDPLTRTLYVAQHGLDRITAYHLDDDGLPPRKPETGEPFASCVHGRAPSRYAGVLFQDGRVYATAEAGRVDVFRTAPDGRLCSCAPCQPAGDGDCTKKERCEATDPCIPTTADECPATGNNVDPTTPLLQRRGLFGPTSLFIIDGTLIVQEALTHRLATFRLADLQPVQPRVCAAGANVSKACTVATEATDCPQSFCGVQRVCVDGVNLGKSCKTTTEETDCPGSTCGLVAPRRASRTGQLERYVQMVQAGSDTLIGSQFFRGRLDAFRLQSPGKSNCKLTTCPGTGTHCCLPHKQSARSTEDVRMSPVGLAVAPAPDGRVLYVAAGEDDRVRAYRLYDNGLFRTHAPFDQTSEQKGSFPNAVAVAVLPDPCR